ncbi:MAG: thioesterase [Euryarchaeota archaeon]|nr:thioesterase [Euryarchaeota archaeon]
MTKTQKMIYNEMFVKDAFSKWLGIEIIEISKGYSQLKMIVTEKMLNGFKIAHGGITYSLADSALAFASNAHGNKCISIETSISHTDSVNLGDILIATTEELSLTNKTGLYLVTISNQNNKEIAYFKGTVYRTSKEWSNNEN